MSVKYQISGSATINGVILINNANGKIVRAIRSHDGTVSVKDLPIAGKVMGLYKARIESTVAKIPILRELFKILIMFIIIISSFIAGIAEIFYFHQKWTFKSIISFIVLVTGLYVLMFSDLYPAIAAFIILIAFFHRDIVEVLKYHGAEHKCINMYESSNNISAITIEMVRGFPRTHTRCGTNIVFLFVPLSIIFYFVLEQSFTLMAAGSVYDLVGSVLLLVISIELFRLFQKPLMQFMLKPGIFLQRFVTTREPERSHLEVAVKALAAVLA